MEPFSNLKTRESDNPGIKTDIKNKCAAVTIIAKNYLAFAKVLANSLHQYNADVEFHLLIVDRPGFSFTEIDNTSISIIDPLCLMGAMQYKRMAEKYDIREFCTSVKPFALRYLFDLGYAKVMYFDPDILITDSLAGILCELDNANIVLTPHLLEPLPMDGNKPDEISILKTGAYNLGFIGLRAGPETRRFLSWWSDRLDFLCKDATRIGLFVDQKWIDLVPGMFTGVTILKNAGYNVAYWNITTRRLAMENGQYVVGDDKAPLVFYHFSGFNPRNVTELSRHDTRTSLGTQPVLAGLVKYYADLLENNGYARYYSLPYCPTVPDGLNVVGYLTAELGVGEAARGYIAALKNLGIKIAMNDYAKGSYSRNGDKSLTGFSIDNPYSINLVCVNPSGTNKFIRDHGYQYFNGKFNIGVWWWELPKLPDNWNRYFRYYDQIWVGTEFARKTIQAETTKPVIRVPPVVEVHIGEVCSRAHFRLPEDEYIFLFVFDFLSVFERKNPLGIVNAFKRAFIHDEPVRLILKCINESHDPENFKKLKQQAHDARITIMNGYLSKDEKNGLIQAADCCISLHRSEGFGYTLAEAMYLGKPVIATGWSGNEDFMSPENSYPVNYKLVEIDADYGPYRRGQTWAEPDLEHAMSLMQEVYRNPDQARRKGELAAEYIQANHSSAAVAKIINNILYEAPISSSRKRKGLGYRLLLWIFTSYHPRRLMVMIADKLPLRVTVSLRNLLIKAGLF